MDPYREELKASIHSEMMELEERFGQIVLKELEIVRDCGKLSIAAACDMMLATIHKLRSAHLTVQWYADRGKV